MQQFSIGIPAYDDGNISKTRWLWHQKNMINSGEKKKLTPFFYTQWVYQGNCLCTTIITWGSWNKKSDNFCCSLSDMYMLVWVEWVSTWCCSCDSRFVQGALNIFSDIRRSKDFRYSQINIRYLCKVFQSCTNFVISKIPVWNTYIYTGLS